MSETIDLKKRILDCVDLPVKAVFVPEWNNLTVYVRAMTAAERDAFLFEKWKAKEEKEEGSPISGADVMNNITAQTLVRVICSDPEGKKRIFDDSDAVELGKKSARALDRLNDALKEMNGDLIEGEELAKNLQGQNVDSGLSIAEDQE